MLRLADLARFIERTCTEHASIASLEMFYTFGFGSTIADIDVDVFVSGRPTGNHVAAPKLKRFNFCIMGDKSEIYSLNIPLLQTELSAKLNAPWCPTKTSEYRIREISVRGAILDMHPLNATSILPPLLNSLAPTESINGTDQTILAVG